MRRLAVLLIAALAGTSCGNSPTLPTTTPSPTPEYFTGSMSPGESMFYSFTVVNAGLTEITLQSLLPDQTNAPALSIPMSIGIGTPAGTGCSTTSTVVVAPGLAPQLATNTTATIYCAQISDIGRLSGPVSFVVKIVHS